MKEIYNSLVIAFAMYSKIPMPHADWSEKNKKYVMVFFPLVGAVIGGFFLLWSFFEEFAGLNEILTTAGFVLIPLLVTGGIHMDGLMDTADALASCQPVSKKLEILKDPHAGAFAVMTCVGYILILFGLYFEMTKTSIYILAIGFILSRALSGLAVVSFPLAKNSGLAAMFQKESDKKIAKAGCIILTLLCMILMVLVHSIAGAFCIMGAFFAYVYYYRMSKKEFGGITGDLAGYFLQICELAMAVAVLIAEKV